MVHHIARMAAVLTVALAAAAALRAAPEPLRRVSGASTASNSPVTIGVRDVPLWKVVEMLKRTAPDLQYTVPGPLRERRVTGRFDAVNASEALAKVLQSLGVQAVSEPNGAVAQRLYLHLELGRGPAQAPGAAYTAEDITYDAASGLTLLTAPSAESRKTLLADRQPTPFLRAALGREAATLSGHVSDAAQGGRTSYLEQVAPGLYQRVDLWERLGYSVTVTVTVADGDVSGPTHSARVQLAREAVVGGELDSRLGAYVGLPSVKRMEASAELQLRPGKPVLLIWLRNVPGSQAAPLVVLIELTEQ